MVKALTLQLAAACLPCEFKARLGQDFFQSITGYNVSPLHAETLMY